MTKEQIEKSLIEGKLQLSFWKTIDHYFVVVFLLVIPMMPIFKNWKDGTELSTGELTLILIFGGLGFFFLWLQSQRLKFKNHTTKLDASTLNDTINAVATELEWDIQQQTDEYIMAKTHPSFWSGSWGEQITILLDRNEVYVNSICDPDKRSSVVSFGRNKQNMNTLINAITKKEDNKL